MHGARVPLVHPYITLPCSNILYCTALHCTIHLLYCPVLHCSGEAQRAGILVSLFWPLQVPEYCFGFQGASNGASKTRLLPLTLPHYGPTAR